MKIEDNSVYGGRPLEKSRLLHISGYITDDLVKFTKMYCTSNQVSRSTMVA